MWWVFFTFHTLGSQVEGQDVESNRHLLLLMHYFGLSLSLSNCHVFFTSSFLNSLPFFYTQGSLIEGQNIKSSCCLQQLTHYFKLSRSLSNFHAFFSSRFRYQGQIDIRSLLSFAPRWSLCPRIGYKGISRHRIMQVFLRFFHSVVYQ